MSVSPRGRVETKTAFVVVTAFAGADGVSIGRFVDEPGMMISDGEQVVLRDGLQRAVHATLHDLPVVGRLVNLTSGAVAAEGADCHRRGGSAAFSTRAFSKTSALCVLPVGTIPTSIKDVTMMVPDGTKVKEKDMAAASGASPSPAGAEATSARARIIDAAFAAFSAQGYSQTSMLAIATRARVSKRELYALVGSKRDMLVACITERAARMRPPADIPGPRDREGLAGVLAAFGERVLREVSDPVVIGVFRLAIAEAERAPEVAVELDSIGRAGARRELAAVLEKAQVRGLLSGNPAEMATQFLALLWGDLMMGLLLRLVDPPTPEEAGLRARDAASAFLRLNPP